jgi:hypothetical protein
MFKYFLPDRDIAFSELAKVNFENYDIKFEVQADIDECQTGRLICDGSTVLVRTNKEGIVIKIVPVETNIAGVKYMLDVVGGEFSAVFSTEYDSTAPYRYVREEIEVD